ncbi:hypothetical protein [Defluviimonas sp. SAOS-178_SWC]|uniref:hypothetical protein n=1 Tax=Defluviimonas sp. SAOS-178_SWC TaxID=3121287 RepID=UPI00322186FE
MSAFDTIVIVDWSGGNDRVAKPKKDAIWSAVIRDGKAEPSAYHRNRVVAGDWLTRLFAEELAAGHRVFAGFDVPFDYPEGLASRVTGSLRFDGLAADIPGLPRKGHKATGPDDIRDEVQVRTLAARIHGMQARGELAATLADVPHPARREEGWTSGLDAAAAESEAA